MKVTMIPNVIGALGTVTKGLMHGHGLKDYIEKRGENPIYNHQKKYWQHEDKQKGNYQKTKMGRKTTLQTF